MKIGKETKNKISEREYRRLRLLMRSKIVSRTTKDGIYRKLIRATAVYACEAGALRKSEEERLEPWKRKTLRVIYEYVKTEED